MPSVHRFVAPAKLNLFLHVVGRRDDGYHLIQSAMQLVDLADELTIAVRDDGRIVRDGDVRGVPEDADLAIRAARLLKAETGTAAGATITVTKKIPIGGGLGGGSSDAATTLLALNRLWKLDLRRSRLAELGALLGADVPFFIGGTGAFVEGIGDRLTPIALPDAHYAVVHPGVGVPTATIFAAPELTRDHPPLKISDFSANGSSSFATAGPTSAAGFEDAFAVEAPVLRNDLEAVATGRYDAVRQALTWLAKADGARGLARMSGSGACVFREFDDRGRAASAVASLPAGWSGWAVDAVAVHPHRDFADD